MAERRRPGFLRELVSLQRGHDLPIQDRQPGKIPVLGSFGVTGTHNESRALGPGVTIGRSGASLGVVTHTPDDYWPLNTVLYVTNFHGNDPRFVYYLLRTIDFTRFNSGSAQPSLNRNFVGSVPVSIPALREQRRIAALLGAVDDKIELNQRMNRTLEETARSIFESWFVDFDPVRGATTVPDEIRGQFPDRLVDSPIGTIPDGWALVRASELVEVTRQQVTPGDSPDELFDHYSIPAFDAGRAPLVELGKSIRSNKFVVAEGCVLLSKLNPRFPRVWLPLPERERRRVSSTEFLVSHPRAGVSQEFVYGLFTSQAFKEKFASRVRGTSGSHQRVQPADFLALRFLRPSKGVLDAFGKAVSPMLSRMQLNLLESLTLVDLRDTLLPKLISGAVQLKDAS